VSCQLYMIVGLGFRLKSMNVREVLEEDIASLASKSSYCSKGAPQNLSVGVALNVRFTTNGMCTKNNTHIYVARTSNNRVISSGDLYCCLLPQCEALRTCPVGPADHNSIKYVKVKSCHNYHLNIFFKVQILK